MATVGRGMPSRKRRRKRSGKKIALAIIVLLVIVVIIAVVVSPEPKWRNVDTSGNDDSNETQDQNTPSDKPPASNDTIVTRSGNSTVYFIDVGQGDAQLIKTADGRNVLIDAGPPASGNALVSFLVEHNATTLDAFVLTHPDADHIGGGDDVLAACTVLSVYQSGYVSTSKTYAAFQAAVVAEGCPAYNDTHLDPGDRLDINSSVTFEIVAINAQSSNANDASLIIKMTDGTVDFLFMGDASSSVERNMESALGSALDVEILKVGHHGSASSTSASFLSLTTPAVAVIGVGTGNTYGHPTNEALERLNAAGTLVYRTDLNGTVTITTDGTSWEVICER
jgi:competence protein ComEC